MSELINTRTNSRNTRWHLLITASASALIAASCAASDARADDDQDRPSVWIELGGQLERQTGQGDVFPVPFVVDNPDSFAFNPVSPFHVERPPLYSNGFEANLTFEPDHSGWVFSAGILYGRSNSRSVHNQGRLLTDVEPFTRYPKRHYTSGGQVTWSLPKTGSFTKQEYEFAGTQVVQSQSHAVVDFTAGKDVGLGMLGRGSTSTFSLGVRFAQFASRSSAIIHARPDAIFSDYCNAYLAAYFAPIFPSHNFKFCFPRSPTAHARAASSQSYRNFRGVGPSISWNASTPILGNRDAEALTLDWGVNAALLFGRQRASGNHQTSGSYYGYNDGIPTQYTHMEKFDRSRAIIVPNVGGLIGLSLTFPNAKVSLGYRGDFFFGAMDTGFDTRETKTVGFYGPFATISIGIGG